MDKKRCALWMVVLTLAMIGVGSSWMRAKERADLATPSMIRWHFLANSDAPADQMLKSEVKDAVMNAAVTWFASAESMMDCRRILAENLLTMQTIAQERLKALGSEQTVKIYYQPTYFPTRQWSEKLFLAAGQYEAVRFIIGSGQGHNWWCLLFPPISPGSEVIFAVPPQSDPSIPALSSDKSVQIPDKLQNQAGNWLEAANMKKDDSSKRVKIKPCFKLWELWSDSQASALGDVHDTTDGDLAK